MKAPKTTESNFEKHPAGWTTVVCTRVIDVGTHWNEGKQKYQRKIMLGFESDKLMQSGEYAGEPFLLFANFNYSMYQNAHLCQFIENWRGKRFASQPEADNFDLSKLIGQSAFVNVVHSDDGKYTNIQTIGPVPEDRKAPEIKGKTILIDQSNLDMKEVEKLSDKMKDRVMSAKEREVGESAGQSSQSTVNQNATGKPSSGTITTAMEPAKAEYDERNPPPQDFDDDIPI